MLWQLSYLSVLAIGIAPLIKVLAHFVKYMPALYPLFKLFAGSVGSSIPNYSMRSAF